jgi:hypothetical protein
MTDWRPIPDYDKYECNADGDIRDIATGTLKEYRKGVRGESVRLHQNSTNRSFTRSRIAREVWRYDWVQHLDDNETATEIKGHPGYYITNKGRCYSDKTNTWMTPAVGNHYYHTFRFNGKTGQAVHTLVGRHFLPDYEPGLNILHRDETLPHPQIDYVDNLYVGTQSDNLTDAYNKGRLHIGKQQMKQFEDDFAEFQEKYFKLVWYARSHPDCEVAKNPQSRVEEMYPDELDDLRDAPDWNHGFNSGCLATMRYVMTALFPFDIPDEENGGTFTVGGLDDAKEEFPMLDT